MKKELFVGLYSLVSLQFFAMFSEYFFSVSTLYAWVPDYCHMRKFYGNLGLIVLSSVRKHT